jgi:hypothetical protein
MRNVSHRVDSSPTGSESQAVATGRNRWQTLRPEGVRPPAVDTAGAPRDGQQSTQTALLGAERFPDVSTALSTTSVNPMPCTVQYAIVELPPMMLSG